MESCHDTKNGEVGTHLVGIPDPPTHGVEHVKKSIRKIANIFHGFFGRVSGG
jgi:hypothetical protein